jgi:hypothetical protein
VKAVRLETRRHDHDEVIFATRRHACSWLARGAYEEMVQRRLSLGRVEVTGRNDMPLGLHDPRAEARRA